MTEKQFKSGEVIFRQGDEGECFYRILDGSVEVILDYGEESALNLTELKKDQFLGEMAIIEKYRRSATAVAGPEGAVLAEIPSGEMETWLAGDPDSIMALMKQLGSRLTDLTRDYEEVSTLLRELKGDPGKKKDSVFARLAGKHAKFRNSGHRSVDDAIDDAVLLGKYGEHSKGFASQIEEYPAGTIICKEGMTRNCMYDIHWGCVGIFTGYGTDQEIKLTELYPNTFFGEMGMISNQPRSATAVALEKTTLEIILPEDLRKLSEKNPPKAYMILAHLSKRLRTLTVQYESACDEVARILDC